MSNLANIRNGIRLVIASRLTDAEIITAINTASAEDVESYSWAGLKASRVINSSGIIGVGNMLNPLPPQLVDIAATFGTVAVTQGSNVVVGYNTNFQPLHVGWKVRIAGQMFAPFNIIGVDPDSQLLTLDAPYQLPTATEQGYALFMQYYEAPDFHLILNITQQIRLRQQSHEDFDFRDPFRAQFASPSVDWAPAGFAPGGGARFELWPIDNAVNGYVVQGLLSHVDLVNPTDRPLISAQVIQTKATAICCASLFSLSGDERWANQRDSFWEKYKEELETARMQDRKQYGEIQQIRDALPPFPGLDRIWNRNDPTWG